MQLGERLYHLAKGELDRAETPHLKEVAPGGTAPATPPAPDEEMNGQWPLAWNDWTPQKKAAWFDKAHGIDDAVFDQSRIYYPDGAYRDANPLGIYHLPPTDAHECARRVVSHRRVKSEIAERNFRHAKEALHAAAVHAAKTLTHITPAPPPSDESVARLELLAAEVHKRQAAYDVAVKAIEAAKPPLVTEREAFAAANAPRYADAIERISNVRI